MAKIIHIADLHLGTSFKNIKNSDMASEMHKNALINIINIANDEKVDFILIAGDLFHKNTVEISYASEIFNIISKSNCPVLISPGNHDFLHPKSPYNNLALSENIFVFSDNSLKFFEFGNVRIYGAAFHSQYCHIDINTDLSDEMINICLIHSDIDTKSGYNHLSFENISNSGYDYLAIGHNHSYSGIKTAGETVYACPGVLMGTGFDEVGEKGCLIGNISKRCVDLQFKSFKFLEFLEIETNVEVLDKCLQELRIYPNCEKIVLTLIINGETNSPIFPELSNFFDVRIRDNTVPFIDIWAGLYSDDIIGIITRKFKEDLDNNPQDKDLITQALRLSISSFNN